MHRYSPDCWILLWFIGILAVINRSDSESVSGKPILILIKWLGWYLWESDWKISIHQKYRKLNHDIWLSLNKGQFSAWGAKVELH